MGQAAHDLRGYREEVSENNILGDYLRARRELIQPGSVGLPVTGVRRVAGLRREDRAY